MAERTANDSSDPKKQEFLTKLTSLAMFVGLAAAYGTLAAIMARFLYPSRPSPRGWMFVSNLGRFDRGESRLFRTPSGESVNITRQGDGSAAGISWRFRVCALTSDAKCTGSHTTTGTSVRAITASSRPMVWRPRDLQPMPANRFSSTR